jgi:hypothetical protein
VRRDLEILIFGYVVVTQALFLTGFAYDDKYTLQTLVALLFSCALLAAFWPRRKEESALSEVDAPDEPHAAAS